MNQPTSYLWHDYESTGIDKARDRPTQFAAIRTDADLNEIDEPIDVFCKISPDVCPSPVAALLTKILPQQCEKQGLSEADFADFIMGQMMQPGTCSVGFNSLKFDDEISRHLFYRNLRDPYAREWQNGNTRWDIIDLVRTTYAFRPEGIEWPMGEDGAVSFRLEDLAKANNLIVDRAHDALSDVRTTIALAKLIKEKQPKLFDHFLGLRDKKQVLSLLQNPARPVLAHVATMHGKHHRCVGLVVPVGPHPTNKNAYIVADLSADPSEWISKSAQEWSERLYVRHEDDSEGPRNFLRVIQANKCPALFASGLVKQDKERFSFLDLDQVTAHWKVITENTELLKKAQQAYLISEANRPAFVDPELSLYSGFTSNDDRRQLNQILLLPPEDLATRTFRFQDPKWETLLFRYRARNWPETLGPEEKEEWDRFVQQRLHENSEVGHRTVAQALEELQMMLDQGRVKEDDPDYHALKNWLQEKALPPSPALPRPQL